MLNFGRLDATALTETALRRAGRSRYSDPSFYEPLRKLLSAYENEAALSLFGRFAARFDILRCLTNLAHLDAAEDVDPSITARPITAPLFITGLPRSSTTFLHTLLAQDPANAVPLCWQLIYPFPPRRPWFGKDRRRDLVEWQFRIFKLLSPGVADLHSLSAEAPQECTDITAQVFQSLRFDTTHHIPSYQNWFDQQSQDNAFRFHRRFLQNLDAQAPGRRWVLKSPDHVFCLDAIANTYPDARMVFLHRDPLSVVGSCAKLTEVLRKPFSRAVDPLVVGKNVADRLVASAERMVVADGADNILHLHFRDVIADPMAAVAKVYAHCGRDLPPAAKLKMLSWLASRPRARSRRHYDLAEFGLEAGDLRQRFAGYMRHFAVPMERQAGESV
ncbi:MAG: sulfotransferase [Rhizomicrobium sp.]|nr:sulfotransferase [Rhizomicrobium sp.]